MNSNYSSGNQDANQDRTAFRIIVKALILFTALNAVFFILNPEPALGRISAYNSILPGRVRLPYGDNPQESYNLSLFNIQAMLASHELSGTPKADDEYRVILIGDSATWGFLLPPQQTLTAFINQENLPVSGGKYIKAYNLGYPVMSLTKDLVFLDRALEFEPDLIVWPVTLESFPRDKQLFPPLLQNNPEIVNELIYSHDLDLDLQDTVIAKKTFLDRTIYGARRSLADLIRLQLHGIMWAATGIDHAVPEIYTERMQDLPRDNSFYDFKPPILDYKNLAFEVLSAGISHAGEIPVLIINEPVFISQGENSDIRYNFYYPRWAFDDFRSIMSDLSLKNGWNYFDYWDAVAGAEFTNTAIHMTPEGTRQFAQLIAQTIQKTASH